MVLGKWLQGQEKVGEGEEKDGCLARESSP